MGRLPAKEVPVTLRAAVLAEKPEESLHRLQRQRTTRIIMAVVALVAVFSIGAVFVTLSYEDGPEAAGANRANEATSPQ
jgi:hypothetical protein